MRCEVCGEPGEPICSDPEDPWPLCDDHAEELRRNLDAAGRGPTYTLDEVLASMSWRYRGPLAVLRYLRRIGFRR